ncbi:thioredoxin family protein [Nannocystaceae bacterium ST9]
MAANQIDDKGVRVRCSQCGKLNRLRFAKLDDEGGKCGQCGAALAGALESPADVLDERAFDALIHESALPVLVDYWAPWCGPCRMVAPELDKVAKRSGGRFLIAKVDTQQLRGVGAKMGVQSIPTMAVYRRGRELERSEGARPAPQIEAFVRSALG